MEKEVVILLKAEKLSNFVEGVLNEKDYHIAEGYWGCGNCGNHFLFPMKIIHPLNTVLSVA